MEALRRWPATWVHGWLTRPLDVFIGTFAIVAGLGAVASGVVFRLTTRAGPRAASPGIGSQ
jgi:hypothetical protein